MRAVVLFAGAPAEIALLAIEKYKLGLPQPVAPDSAPKRRAAAVQAGRAVLYALTPGMPPVEQVSMQPRGGSTARIMFRPQEYGRDGDQWHALSYGTRLANAEAPHGPIPAYDFLKVTPRRSSEIPPKQNSLNYRIPR